MLVTHAHQGVVDLHGRDRDSEIENVTNGHGQTHIRSDDVESRCPNWQWL